MITEYITQKLVYTFTADKFKTTVVVVSVDSSMNVPLLGPFFLYGKFKHVCQVVTVDISIFWGIGSQVLFQGTCSSAGLKKSL